MATERGGRPGCVRPVCTETVHCNKECLDFRGSEWETNMFRIPRNLRGDSKALQ